MYFGPSTDHPSDASVSTVVRGHFWCLENLAPQEGQSTSRNLTPADEASVSGNIAYGAREKRYRRS